MAGDVADDVHDFGDAGLGPALVDDGEVGAERCATARARATPPTSGETIISVAGLVVARWMSRVMTGAA